MSSSNIHDDLIRLEGHASTCINKAVSVQQSTSESDSLLVFETLSAPSLTSSLPRTFYLHRNHVQLGTIAINKLSLSNGPKLTRSFIRLHHLTKT